MRLKMYETPIGVISETMIDPGYRDAGLADGSIVERNATFGEAMSDCYRMRIARYDAEIPASRQLDAQYDARKGKPGALEQIDAIKDAIKAEIRKPDPVEYVDPPAPPAPEPEPAASTSGDSAADAPVEPAPEPVATSPDEPAAPPEPAQPAE